DTGAVEIEQFHMVDDCGTVINPLLAEGQVEGGVAQGIAQALFEEMIYSDDGQPLTSTLVDYLAPSAADIPELTSIGRTTTVTPHNTLGAKGIGESGAIGAPPAVINAVVDALSGFGVKHVEMPATPQKIWNLMNGREG
ncbi:MAG: xanthine dehydrogenase family protein molybdopterin-binding subunit, partial [Alphaproteobacteria bacterium]|nr:xanthine dehydrogenase family protein molybdopterin-binding subunit [Alphaproteobacteria bacterium]